MRVAVLLVAVLAAACTSSSTTPTATSPLRTNPGTTPTTTATLTGHVTATNGGQPLPSLAIAIGPQTAISDAGGTFSVMLPSPSTYSVTMNGAIVPRETRVSLSGARDVAIDAIALAGFDLAFYRQLVRNGFEAPGSLEPLRRWTQAPQVYLRTVDTAGAAIDAAMLNATEQTLRETAPIWAGGAFGLAGVTRGTDTREGSPGWITVRWESVIDPTACGRANVAIEGGSIAFFYKNPNCGCSGGPAIRPRSVRHELGHAFGYWHTGSTSDVMSGIGISACDALPSARERAAAAIVYRRPMGNLDPDTDPSSTVSLRPMTAR